MKRIALIQACALIFTSCAGIPDADPPVPKPEACDVRVITDGQTECLTREQFRRWLERNEL